ncbi:MAG: S8 family serine peptidase, partial [Sedimentisphaerales bacterium]|nr:S8 family serine peptidase [Sedimentisphaerales bacterium]
MRKAFLISAIIVAVFLMCIPVKAGSTRQGRSERKVVIGFKESAERQTPESRSSLIRQHGGRARRAYRNVSAVSAELTDSQIASLRANPNVAYVEEDGLLHALDDDDELGASWGVTRIGAGDVHALGNTGKGVKVALIDTGIDYHHTDLDGNYAGGYDFVNDDDDPMDDDGHGTHCAGIIAAEDDNDGVVGVAPEASLYAVKVLDSTGSGYLSDVVAGIDWAIANGMDIISLSMGTNEDYQTMRDACERAGNAGIIVVAAAGNDYRRVRNREWDTVDYPAKYDTVIAVGAIDDTDTRAYFSSTGASIELAAPGIFVYSTDLDQSYSYKSGTSMSCPHVTGVAALILSGPGGDVRTVLQETAEDLGTAGWDKWYGYGLVDAFAAAGTAPKPPVLTTIEISPSSPTLFLGETQEFEANGKDQYGDPIDTGKITWTSSDEKVGTFDTKGIFESTGLGDAIITAT